ncbi:hypothetical protein [Streptomyces sp. NPDC050264]|uniref:hypothetical protein n=1 Tax=Streptomyces sp. NPDC050264 TaxID=3155038 RepID=UPI00343CF750
MEADPLDGPSSVDEAAQRPPAREPTGDDQHQTADRRDRAADTREAEADQRERTADERETAADRRESAADAWQEELAGRVRSLDERLRATGDSAPGLKQRSYEEIERAEELLRSSQARLDRHKASLHRSDEADLRGQDAVDRESTASAAPHAEHKLLFVRVLEAKADRLRSKVVGALDELAAIEDSLVREHEGQVRTVQAAAHRRHAGQARAAADTLRGAGES